MTFQFGTPPDPDKEGIMELHHYRQAVDDYDKDGGLFTGEPMLKHWFVINVCDVLLGENAMYKYSPRELFEKLEEFATPIETLEEIFENKEQIEVSKFYEKLPKPHAVAVEQWLADKVYYRHTDETSK